MLWQFSLFVTEAMIKNIFIDLDDTLWATYLNSKESLHDVYINNHWEEIEPDFDSFWMRYWSTNESLWDEYRQGKITKYELKMTRIRRVFEGKKEWTDEEVMQFNEQFLKQTSTKTRLIEGALDTLAYLHRYYRIYILSNGFREVQRAKIELSGIAPYIDRIILSEDAGINKPHRKIFQYAFSVTNTRACESIMIGDSWEADIIGAFNAGIASIWFNPNQIPLPNNAPQHPTHTISRLEELRHIL